MNRYLLLVAVFLFALGAEAQTSSINTFYHKYKKGKEVTNFTLPGWLIKFGLSVSGEKSSMEEMEIRMIKSIKKLRILSAEDRVVVQDKDYQKLMNGLDKEGFEEWVKVRDGESRVHIMVRTKKDRLKNMLIFAMEEDELTMVSLKSKLPMAEFEEFLASQTIDDFMADF